MEATDADQQERINRWIRSQVLDFSSPELAPLDLTAEKINADTAAEFERLRGLGYEPDGCFVDLGETAETVLASRLRATE